jgi:hypothetical protein
MSLRDIYEPTFDEDVSAGEQSGPVCPECGGIVHTNSIETACEDCGLVVEDRPIDHGPEWRAFDDDERDRRERTGPPLTPTRHDRGLSGEIGFDRTDANGTTLSGRKQSQLARLRREHRRGRWGRKGRTEPRPWSFGGPTDRRRTGPATEPSQSGLSSVPYRCGRGAHRWPVDRGDGRRERVCGLSVCQTASNCWGGWSDVSGL